MMTVEYIGDDITNVVFRGRLDSVGAASVAQQFNAAVASKRAVIVDHFRRRPPASASLYRRSGFLVAGAKAAVKTNGGKLIILCRRTNTSQYGVLQTCAASTSVMPILFDRNEAIAAMRH